MASTEICSPILSQKLSATLPLETLGEKKTVYKMEDHMTKKVTSESFSHRPKVAERRKSGESGGTWWYFRNKIIRIISYLIYS